MSFARPNILIMLTVFHDFDDGKVVEQLVDSRLHLHPGDVVDWEVAQFYGRAEIVSVGGLTESGEYRHCSLKKLH